MKKGIRLQQPQSYQLVRPAQPLQQHPKQPQLPQCPVQPLKQHIKQPYLLISQQQVLPLQQQAVHQQQQQKKLHPALQHHRQPQQKKSRQKAQQQLIALFQQRQRQQRMQKICKRKKQSQQKDSIIGYQNTSAEGNNRTTDSNRIKNELSDIVRPIIQTLHEQYKQKLLQHENALAKED